MQNRHQNHVAHRLSDARFPFVRTFDTFEFAAVPGLNRLQILALGRGGFLDERENVIFIGNSGVGKSHLGLAICHALIYAGFRTRYTTALALSRELLAAQAEHRLPKLLKAYNRYDLVMCDEIGYVPFSRDGSQLLFQFFSDRYERGSVLLTSNLEFSKWGEVFGDATMTSALLDRLTHRAHIFPITADSYRFRQASRKADSA